MKHKNRLSHKNIIKIIEIYKRIHSSMAQSTKINNNSCIMIQHYLLDMRKTTGFFSIFMVLINWKSFTIEFQPLKLASKKYTFICAAQRVSSIKWKQCEILSKNENDDLARLFTVAYYVYCTNCTLLTVWIPIFCLIFCFVFAIVFFTLRMRVCARARCIHEISESWKQCEKGYFNPRLCKNWNFVGIFFWFLWQL